MFEIIYTDKVYIEGFKSSNNRVIDHFIKKNKSKFISYIKHNNTIDCSINIEDLFFETLSDLWENIVHDTYQYQEKASLSTYFFSIGINRLRKEISRTQKISHKTKNELEDESDKKKEGTELEDNYEAREECISIIENNTLEAFFSIDSTCPQILRNHYYEKLKGNVSAKLLGFLNTNVLKTEKTRCMKRLRENFYNELGKQNPNNHYYKNRKR